MLHRDRARSLWDRYVSRQVLLGEILKAEGYLDEAAFKALLLNHARSNQRLGDFLVEQGVISRSSLDEALIRQAALQPTIASLIREEEGAGEDVKRRAI
jgi:adsorption protein B